MTTQAEYEKMSAAEKKKEDWMNSKWRPMMGWLYMATCTFDFVIFPILWSLLQSVMGHPVTQWQPLTLQGAGLYHIAMGAVLGLAAFGRTQEKLAGANNGGANTPSTGFGVPSPAPSSFAAPTAPSFSAPSTPSSFGGGSFGGTPRAAAPAPSFSKPAPAATMTSSTGKAMPIQPDEEEI